MKNTFTNFDINERVRKSIFIDRGGDWTSFTNGQGSMAEQLGCFIPEFVVFVEIYNLDGELILNYPVEHCTEERLEGAMKKQVTLYGKLIENVGISTVAVETSLINTVEWFALKQFKAPEFIILETLERAGRLAESDNEQLSYLDLITKAENDEAGIETPNALAQETPPPALCEHPAELETTALPVVMRARSVRIKPSNDDREDEVDAATDAAIADIDAPPSTKVELATGSLTQAEDSTDAETFAKAPGWTLPALRKATGIIYTVLSWTLLILSIWSIGKVSGG